MNKQELANKIWKTANDMRSTIEANEYKDFILGFIFYKYLSHQELKFLRENAFTDEEIKALSEKETETETIRSKKNNNNALLSFIFSLIGIIVAGLPCGLVAIITGCIGISKFNSEEEKGKWMAITGIIIGAIDVIVVLINMIINLSKI